MHKATNLPFLKSTVWLCFMLGKMCILWFKVCVFTFFRVLGYGLDPSIGQIWILSAFSTVNMHGKSDRHLFSLHNEDLESLSVKIHATVYNGTTVYILIENKGTHYMHFFFYLTCIQIHDTCENDTI